MSFAGKWMELVFIMLHEIKQTQTNTTCFFSNVELRFFFKRQEIRSETIWEEGQLVGVWRMTSNQIKIYYIHL
jgi:hypothetical protein